MFHLRFKSKMCRMSKWSTQSQWHLQVRSRSQLFDSKEWKRMCHLSFRYGTCKRWSWCFILRWYWQTCNLKLPQSLRLQTIHLPNLFRTSLLWWGEMRTNRPNQENRLLWSVWESSDMQTVSEVSHFVSRQTDVPIGKEQKLWLFRRTKTRILCKMSTRLCLWCQRTMRPR